MYLHIKYVFNISLFFVIPFFSAYAQAPQAINYQGVARNSSGQPLLNQSIRLRLSILDGSSTGTVIFVETHQATTNSTGLFSLSIGGGTVVSGSFNSINWGQSSKWLKTEMDATGGSNYQLIGTTKFFSVPYSIYSEKSGNGMPSGVNIGDILYWNGTTWVPVPLPVKNTPSPSPSLVSNNTLSSTQAPADGNGLGLALCGGVPVWGGCPLTISTSPISQISYNSAISGGIITTSDNTYIIASGVCYGTSPAPTISDSKTNDGNGVNFSSSITGLLPNTTYYVRAYGTQGFGTTYGDEISFTTLALSKPTVSTNPVSNISNTSAKCGGNVSNDGGASITARGICWNIKQNPSLADNFTTDGTGPGTYVSDIKALSPNTTYYVRSYASNSVATSYGNEISFTSNTVELPTLTTIEASSINYTSAISGGNITSEGGMPITDRGICWSTSPNPTISNNLATSGSGSGQFIASLTGLSPNTTYYVRSYATNIGGTTYGNEIIFTSKALSLPTVTTTVISGISTTSAAGGGTISDDGGSMITSRGICWSTSSTPTTSDYKTADGSDLGNFLSILSSLTISTTYFVRAYATNALGTAYGSEVSFTTASLIPTFSVPIIGTKSVTVNSESTAFSGGYISYDGGSPVNSRGICWSTSENPTISDNISNDGTGMGLFSSIATGLSGCKVNYYLRAYATNNYGTGYGNQLIFSSGVAPSGIATASIIDITKNTASSGGFIASSGGCPITSKGVCWSNSLNPTTSDSKTIDHSDSNSFISNLTGLLPGITYYVRAYATNDKGTSYGNEQAFTTEIPSGFYIGQVYGGGIIFYIDSTGQHGLIASTSDQGNSGWGCYGLIPGTITSIGGGATNTATIVANCGTEGGAASLCNDLILNGYSDWFLPSLGELGLMYQYRNLIGGFGNLPYWSSNTEWNDTTWAWTFYFANGGTYSFNRYSTTGYVRAIRAF